nr:MAG TPA: hypothetical protein [Caudoviricetes sp.]
MVAVQDVWWQQERLALAELVAHLVILLVPAVLPLSTPYYRLPEV